MNQLSWPFTTLYSEIGRSLSFNVEIVHDNDANVYLATSPGLKGQLIKGETLNQLKHELLALSPRLPPRFLVESGYGYKEPSAFLSLNSVSLDDVMH